MVGPILRPPNYLSIGAPFGLSHTLPSAPTIFMFRNQYNQEHNNFIRMSDMMYVLIRQAL